MLDQNSSTPCIDHVGSVVEQANAASLSETHARSALARTKEQIRRFAEQTPGADHLAIDIQIPAGFFRTADLPIHRVSQRIRVFILVETGSLTLDIPLSKKSSASAWAEQRLTNEKKRNYCIDHPHALSVMDARRLVTFALGYFKGVETSVRTTNSNEW